jgi:hypothetical protein
MTLRIIKSGIVAVGGLGAVLMITLISVLLVDYRDYQNVETTSALLRDGKYDPALHFTFDRACVFPPESAAASTLLTDRGYREVGKIFPDTFTNWTLVLIDDDKKTFRTLYALEPSVKLSGGVVCNSKITLETKKVDGQLTAYVKEANAG